MKNSILFLVELFNGFEPVGNYPITFNDIAKERDICTLIVYAYHLQGYKKTTPCKTLQSLIAYCTYRINLLAKAGKGVGIKTICNN